MKKENKEIKEKNEEIVEENEVMEKVSLAKVGEAIFIEPEKEETDVKEEIAQYPDEVVSPEVKKELQAAIDRVDKGIMKPTNGGEARKTKSLNVTVEQSKDYLEKNPVHINTKSKIDKQTGKVVKARNDKEQEEKEEEIGR